MRPRTRRFRGAGTTACLVAIVALAAGASAASSPASPSSSLQYRLHGAGPAALAGRATSTVHTLDGAGGNGMPNGIAAGTSSSVVSGNASTQLPTDRIFADGYGP